MFASGSERYASERVEARVSVKIAVRYFAGLLEADRVVINSKPYNIRFINNVDFRDEWLEISLDGGVAQ
jgi:head-tail adaptor